MRSDGNTGAPLPAPGKPDAIFITSGDRELQRLVGLIFGRDGTLYVISRSNDRVLRYCGTTGDFLDTFVPAGFGGLHYSRGLVFGLDGNLDVGTTSASSSDNSVVRCAGATGEFLDTFVSPGSGGLRHSLLHGNLADWPVKSLFHNGFAVRQRHQEVGGVPPLLKWNSRSACPRVWHDSPHSEALQRAGTLPESFHVGG
jgi:hypothetical protein